MLLWILFMAIMLFAAAAAVYFLVRSVHGLGFVAAISKNRRVAGWLLSTAVVLLPAVLLSFILGIMNSVIIYLHLTLAWLLTEGIRRIAAVAFKKNIRNYLSAAAAFQSESDIYLLGIPFVITNYFCGDKPIYADAEQESNPIKP